MVYTVKMKGETREVAGPPGLLFSQILALVGKHTFPLEINRYPVLARDDKERTLPMWYSV
jgi:hypothetical protein